MRWTRRLTSVEYDETTSQKFRFEFFHSYSFSLTSDIASDRSRGWGGPKIKVIHKRYLQISTTSRTMNKQANRFCTFSNTKLLQKAGLQFTAVDMDYPQKNFDIVDFRRKKMDFSVTRREETGNVLISLLVLLFLTLFVWALHSVLVADLAKNTRRHRFGESRIQNLPANEHSLDAPVQATTLQRTDEYTFGIFLLQCAARECVLLS